ncbi:hypothetical protein DL96DRAFT_1021009 [Flagelloscypha sp. PMI_526]|nr:hypothetical protein DL96DRAFT_1021009 [Flagelloscypha sp. PMI_526]
MEVSHHLPLDILRLLLEFSAATNLESARVLSLVSKDVQLWADPYVFQVVRGPRKNNSDESSSTLLARMCRSDASPRLVLARNYVHTAAWKENVKQKFYIKQALEHFPNMTQFCLWGNIFPFRPEHDTSNTRPFEITQGYPSVRRVATCILYQSTVPPNAFGSPFWMTITHLQVNYYAAVSSVGSPFYLPLFATMTSLTHLALPAFAGESEPNADLALSLVKETFPPSLILCLLSLVAPERVDRNNWLAGMITASRRLMKESSCGLLSRRTRQTTL